jgi:proteasome component ECM29
MTRLWTAIVKEPARSVTEHIHSILPELIRSSGAEAWREREGACLALNDALHGRTAADVLPHLEQLWRATMRAIDDVKDTVREAALMVQQVIIHVSDNSNQWRRFGFKTLQCRLCPS